MSTAVQDRRLTRCSPTEYYTDLEEHCGHSEEDAGNVALRRTSRTSCNDSDETINGKEVCRSEGWRGLGHS
jgi:hypothetical protein